MRKDVKILCDIENTKVGFNSLTNEGSIQPMLNRPDVHKASSQDCFINFKSKGKRNDKV
jgi:hypothetical protein